MKFLYTYVFRGLGVVIVLAMVTILWTACNHTGNRAQEERAKEKSKQMLDAMHKDADAAIRKYTSGQVSAAPPKKEKKP